VHACARASLRGARLRAAGVVLGNVLTSACALLCERRLQGVRDALGKNGCQVCQVPFSRHNVEGSYGGGIVLCWCSKSVCLKCYRRILMTTG